MVLTNRKSKRFFFVNNFKNKCETGIVVNQSTILYIQHYLMKNCTCVSSVVDNVELHTLNRQADQLKIPNKSKLIA